MDVVFCSYFAVVAFLTVLSVESTVYMTRETNSIVELHKTDISAPRNVSYSVSDDDGCECVDYNCGCCSHIRIKDLHVDWTLCMNASYLPQEYGISVTLTINGFAIINETVSARNPPPLCVGIPHLEKEASLCLIFYDLDVEKRTFTGCAKVELHFVHIEVVHVKLGCFHLGPNGMFTQQWLNALQKASAMKQLHLPEL